jgi:hypothetical protein
MIYKQVNQSLLIFSHVTQIDYEKKKKDNIYSFNTIAVVSH